MEFTLVLERVFTVALLVYFAAKIISSVQKLNENAIGTGDRKIASNVVLFPSITVCPHHPYSVFDTNVRPTTDLSDLKLETKLKGLVLDTAYFTTAGET